MFVRKARVLKLLQDKPTLTYQEIADRCGCTKAYVSYVNPNKGRHRNYPKRRAKREFTAKEYQTTSPGVVMTHTEWTMDELGIRTREIRGI